MRTHQGGSVVNDPCSSDGVWLLLEGRRGSRPLGRGLPQVTVLLLSTHSGRVMESETPTHLFKH